MTAWISPSHWAAFAAGAVLLFWVVGAHNRLVTLRNQIGSAWAQLDEQLRRRKEALPQLVDALREPLSSEQGTLDSVLAAQTLAQAAADRLRLRPVRSDAVRALGAADSTLGSSLARLLALLDQMPELREREDIDAWLRELHDADLRFAFARQLFNDAGETYNAAAGQFPTNLVAALFGFGQAGLL